MANDPVLYRTVLRPHRSATRLGLNVVVATPALAVSGVGAVFMAIGAWPVTGFLGLDVVLLAVALRLNLRGGRRSETIRLTARELQVRRIDPWGRRLNHSFQPYWLKVVMAGSVDDDPPLLLRSHGRSVRIASFLTAEERLRIAGELRQALAAVQP